MKYHNLEECIMDLEKHGHLVRIHEEVDPHLEMAAIHMKVYAAGGPALLFENVKVRGSARSPTCSGRSNAVNSFFGIPLHPRKTSLRCATIR